MNEINLKILSFIDKFKSRYKNELEDIFSNGYCYWFAKILEERFINYNPEIIYIPIYNHFCIKIFDYYYDISGKIINEEYIKLAVPWKEYILLDKLESDRIIRDCINKDEV